MDEEEGREKGEKGNELLRVGEKYMLNYSADFIITTPVLDLCALLEVRLEKVYIKKSLLVTVIPIVLLLFLGAIVQKDK